MLKRIWQIFILFFIASFLALCQFSLISALPDPFRQFNLVLVYLVLVLFFFDFRLALISALISGFWLDILSFNFFGFYLLIFFATLLIANWILQDWLTNRSFYTLLALMLGLTIFYNLFAASLLALVSSSSNTFFLFKVHFWVTLAYQSFWSLLAALILFNLANLVSRRIKPFFLEKKSFL